MVVISPWQPVQSAPPRWTGRILNILLLALKRDTPTPAPAPTQAASGAYNTFEEFIAGSEADIFGYLWRLTGDEQTAYDLCQETLLRAWQQFGKIRHYEQPGAWLFRVAHRDLIHATLLQLPARERAALVLREVEGFSHSEIGDALGVSANSVRMLLSRARAHFRQRYARADSEEAPE